MNIIRACIALKPPKGGSKMQCPKFEQQATITPKRYEIWCQLVLITNRKSHTVYGYRLIPSSWPWMTLNGVIALILLFSPNSIALLANYVTVVEDRPITSAEYCSPIPVPVFHFGPKVTHRGWLLLVLTHTAARSLCRSWATCIFRAQLHAYETLFQQVQCTRSCQCVQTCPIPDMATEYILAVLIQFTVNWNAMCRINRANGYPSKRPNIKLPAGIMDHWNQMTHNCY